MRSSTLARARFGADLWLPWVACAWLGVGCTGVIDGTGHAPGSAGSSGVGPDGTVNGAGSGGAAVDKPPNMATDCEGWDIAMSKRVIRLSFNQLATSLRPVFGDEFADKMVTEHAIKDPSERTFPPLGDTDEGSSYIDTKWQTADAIASAAGQRAFENFASFTSCGAAPTAECAQAFVLTLAEKAFRRPLIEREKASLLQVYADVIKGAGTIQQATRGSITAVFSSPHFLYRTELGGDATVEGPISQFELASQLSYFVTDGPPDDLLRAAAAANKLSTPQEISPHIDRMLATPSAKLNLQSAVIAWLGISKVLSVTIDETKVPTTEFNSAVAASMFHETELFVRNVLWNGGKVPDLVTSRKSFINGKLASLYGVAAPSASLDADGFGAVELPANRAGLLTSLGFLTSRSRTDEQSVVGRGLSVNDAILCQQNPEFPAALADQIKAVQAMQSTLSEREKATYRDTTLPCSGCHESFDPFGLSLENFDTIGKFRTMDPQGRAIDASVVLPASAQSLPAANAVEMGAALASSGAFSACAATKLLTYALAETGVKGTSCATKAVAEAFAKTDLSFAALVREVAASKTITHRSKGM
jgi:hypothetical protein